MSLSVLCDLSGGELILQPALNVRPMTSRSRLRFSALTLIAVGLALAVGLRAETGYDLWLRYVPVTDPVERGVYRQSITALA